MKDMRWNMIAEYVVLLLISVIAWSSPYVEVFGLYPDWDDATDALMAKCIRVIVIISWSGWFVSILSQRLRWVQFWFKAGLCSALFLFFVRLVFYKEMNGLLDYVLRILRN
jgi:hypothetical protein